MRSEAVALLATNPRSVALLSIAASACYSLGLFEEARGYLERALELQPDSAALQSSLAKVRNKLG